MSFYKKNKGFTLAEVLITIGIIGVVTAVTIPTLITNYQKKATVSKIKSAYSQVSQALKLSENDNGELSSWDFSQRTDSFTKQYIEPYFKGMYLCPYDKCPKGITTSGDVRYLLGNGTQLTFYVINNKLLVSIDLDGPNGKNIQGYDRFYFNTDPKHRIVPTGWYEGITRADALNGFTTSSGNKFECLKNSNGNPYYRHSCTHLLMIDGWEMKKDYPW